MKKFIRLILFLLVFCAVNTVFANEPMMRDSLSKEQIIKYAQKQLAAIIERNKRFEVESEFDSLRYVLNINTDNIINDIANEEYPNASYIKQMRPSGVQHLAEYILNEEKLDQFNDMLIAMNAEQGTQGIKSYLLLVNFVPLRIDEQKDFKTVAEVYYNVQKDRKVDAEYKKDEILVRKALEQGEDIVKGVTQPFLNTMDGKVVFMGWLKFKTVYKNRKTTQLITIYYPNSKGLDAEKGYTNILKRYVDEYRFATIPASEVYEFIDLIKKANESYKDVEELNNTILSIHDPIEMELKLSVLGGESYVIFDVAKRIHILKVLTSQLMPDSRQELVNNILATTPEGDFDLLLSKLIEVNEEAKQTFTVPGHAPELNPKYNFTLLSCLVYSLEDAECAFCFGEHNYTQMLTHLMKIYRHSKKFITQVKYLWETEDINELKLRKIVWDRSYFLSVKEKPEDAQDPVVTYDNYSSEVTFKVKELMGYRCEDKYVQISGGTGGASVSYKYCDCGNVYDYTGDRELGPFDIITFTDKSDLSLLKSVTATGQQALGSNTMAEIYAPALLLKYASDKKWNKDVFKAVDLGLNVATILIPAGNVAYLGRNINYLYKFIEYAIKVGATMQILKDANVFENYPKIDSFISTYQAIVNTFGVVNIQLGIAEIYQTSKFKRMLRQDAERYFNKLYESEKELFDLRNVKPELLSEEKLKEIYAFSKSLEDMGKAAGYGDDWVLAIRRSVMSKIGIAENKIFDELFRTWKNKITMPPGNNITAINDIHGHPVAHFSQDGKMLHLDAVGEIPNDGKFLSIVEDEYFVPPGKSMPIKEDIILYERANGEIICVVGACFVKGTKIHTKNGLSSIETIKEKDVVLSYDEEKKVNVWQKVKSVFSKNVNKLVQVIVNRDTIIVTPEHPFYTEKGWRSAKELIAGLKLKMASGALAAILSVKTFDSVATVYNFSVENTHTYYVDQDGILVHNDCARVAAIVPRLEDDILKDLFVKDFANATGKRADLLTKIEQKPSRLTAWRVLEKRPNLRVSEDLIEVVDQILANNKISVDKLKAALNNVADGLVPGWTGVERTAAVIHKFRNHANFEKVITGMASTKGPRIRRGAGFVLRWADDIGPDLIDMFEHVYVTDAKFAADLLLHDGTKIDCKSWSAVKSIDEIPNNGVTKQFVSYFDNPPFEMWFDLERFKEFESLPEYKNFTIEEAVDHIKGKYQELFSKGNTKYETAYEKLKNSRRFNDLNITSLAVFGTYVDDLTSELYNFVKVK